MNKIDFQINCKITYYIIILNKSKPLHFVYFDNRNYVISMKIINVKDWSVSSFVILKSVHILYKWSKNNLSNDIILIVLLIKYLNN